MKRVLHLFGPSCRQRQPDSEKVQGDNDLTSPTGNQTKESEKTRDVPQITITGPDSSQNNQKSQALAPSSPRMTYSPSSPSAAQNPDDDRASTSSAEGAFEKLRNLTIFKNPLKSPGRFREEIITSPDVIKSESIKSVEMIVEKSLVSNLKSLNIVQEGVNYFLSGNDQLIGFLDDISRIHPAVAVVVVAFKVAWRLGKTHQENDKRIVALYVSMTNMVAVLRRLRGIPKEKTETNNNQVKEVVDLTLTEISERAAKDIQQCANMCDTYSKKKMIVKVLNGSFWQTEFSKYLKIFVTHRQNFEFALTIHIAGGVENGLELQKKHGEAIAQLDEKLSNISTLLMKLASPAEKDAAQLIDRKGGIEKVIQTIKSNDSQSDALLRELNEYERGKFSSQQSGPGAGKPRNLQDAMEDLRKEIQMDQNQAIKKNLEYFQRKFNVQQKQFREEIEQVVRKVGDNIIRSVAAGSYSRILDENVQKVWKEMILVIPVLAIWFNCSQEWGGSVKARYFVMALHDYVCGKWSLDESESQPKDGGISFNKLRNVFQRSAKKGPENEDDDGSGPDADDAEPEWALRYLNPTNAQALSEAFDEDASGFITIREVNVYSFKTRWLESSSLDCVLGHRFVRNPCRVYEREQLSCIGWYQSLGHYRDELLNLIAKLLRYLPSVRQENRRAADQYLERMLTCILPIVHSLNAVEEDDILTAKFEDYNKQVERRLKDMLEKVHYTINGKDGFKMVIENERVEKRLFPLLYLLIGRHLDIFKVVMKKVLHPSELEDATDSIEAITEVVSDRVRKLEVIFTQQKLRVNEYFRGFANGMFEYTNEPSKFWSVETLRRIDSYRPYSYYFRDDDEDDPEELDPNIICNYEPSEVPFWTLEKAFKEAYSGDVKSSESNSEEPDNKDADDGDTADEKSPSATGGDDNSEWISKLSDHEWNGFCDSDSSDVEVQLLSFRFVVNDETQDEDHRDVEVEGSISTQSLQYSSRGICKTIRSIQGIILEPVADEGFQLAGNISSTDSGIMTGKIAIRISPTETTTCTFFLEQRLHDTEFYYQYRPPSSEFERSKPRALWKFAFTAVMAQVSAGNTFCLAFWDERKRVRGRFVDLSLERKVGGSLGDETDTYWSIRMSLRDEDENYYEALVDEKLKKQPKHCGYGCDHCNRVIYGARTLCITCIENNGFNTVDFCDRNDCVTAQKTLGRSDLAIPHLSSHKLLKARRMVFQATLGRTVKNANRTQEIIKNLLAESRSELANSTRKQRSASSADLTCTFCQSKVSSPFWACIECDTTCVCMECDKAGKAAVPKEYDGKHNFDEHVLLKWSPGFAVPTMEERLARIEANLAKTAELVAALTKNGLQGLETPTWNSI